MKNRMELKGFTEKSSALIETALLGMVNAGW
jgi:hypothetical protein